MSENELEKNKPTDKEIEELVSRVVDGIASFCKKLKDYYAEHKDEIDAKVAELREQAVCVPLKDCPIGLFEYKGSLCLKTEYSLDDCYTVDSGEIFWGDAKTKEERENLLVHPTSIEEMQKQTVKDILKRIYERDTIGYCRIKDFAKDYYGVHLDDTP